MRYELYANLLGLSLFVIGFGSSQIIILLLGLAVSLLSSLTRLYEVLSKYLPAILVGKKPNPKQDLATVLGVFTQGLAVFALITRFSFWDINPAFMRTVLYLYVPVLFVLLIHLRLTTSTEMVAHYRYLLVMLLVVIGSAFLFFLTPEKKLVQRFYASQPEKLRILLPDIEKRTPKPKVKR